MKLQKFDYEMKDNAKKNRASKIIIAIVAAIAVFVIYKTYALFQTTTESQNIIKGVVGDFSQSTDELSAATNYTGYYADIDKDGTADGVIFVDLLKTANENNDTVSGTWNSTSDQADRNTYSYSTIESSKAYSISSSNYDGLFGSYPIISLKDGSSGSDRFYVMALSDVAEQGSIMWSWNYNWSDNQYSMGVGYLEETATTQVSMQASDGQSIGKRNTEILIDVEYFKTYTYNLWNFIEDEVDAGWFVPSRAEWAAFGDYAYSKLKITSTTYDNVGLSERYWSSSMRTYGLIWGANIKKGYIGTHAAAANGDMINTRLAKTF